MSDLQIHSLYTNHWIKLVKYFWLRRVVPVLDAYV